MLCDRNTTNFAKGQVGFINFMIVPYFTVLSELAPKMSQFVEQAKDNCEQYKQLVDQYEE